MPGQLQTFLAKATQEASEDLLKAFDNLPEEKRVWSPMGDARTALNMMAECAIMNSDNPGFIKSRAFPTDYDFGGYMARLGELAQDWTKVKKLFDETLPPLIATIKDVPDDALSTIYKLPWGDYDMPQLLSYPYWNMKYHEGQINYIASMLGLLK
jgi:hypothetical protein